MKTKIQNLHPGSKKPQQGISKHPKKELQQKIEVIFAFKNSKTKKSSKKVILITKPKKTNQKQSRLLRKI